MKNRISASDCGQHAWCIEWNCRSFIAADLVANIHTHFQQSTMLVHNNNNNGEIINHHCQIQMWIVCTRHTSAHACTTIIMLHFCVRCAYTKHLILCIVYRRYALQHSHSLTHTHIGTAAPSARIDSIKRKKKSVST